MCKGESLFKKLKGRGSSGERSSKWREKGSRKSVGEKEASISLLADQKMLEGPP